MLRAELDAARELRRRLELRLAELERRLPVDSPDSGTPSSKERAGAKEARRTRQQSGRERRADRRRGGQPGHRGKGLDRDPDPDENKDAEPPAQCRRCRTVLDGHRAQAGGGERHPMTRAGDYTLISGISDERGDRTRFRDDKLTPLHPSDNDIEGHKGVAFPFLATIRDLPAYIEPNSPGRTCRLWHR